MAGCTDLAFRLIAREHGAKFCFFEMVDCNSITYGPGRKFHSILKTIGEDQPIAAQLLGRDPSQMLAGAREMLEIIKPSFFDINAACPVKKVVKKHAGAYLIEDPEELCRIVKKLASSLSIPVTVKIRTGYSEPNVTKIVKLAKSCEESGATAIFVHGRTRAQGYIGDIDYASIRAIKEALKIPVIGSGNVFTPELADKMLKETLCDGILVARGALGNPWIFGRIDDYLKGKAGMRAISFAERRTALKKHLSYIEKHKGLRARGRAGFMRKAALWYLKGFPGAAEVRSQISLVKSYGKMLELIDSL